MPATGFARAVRAEAAFLLAMAVVLVGIVGVIIFPQHWLRGILIVASGFALAGLLRLFVSDRRAGMLVVRGKLFDALCYLGSSAAITAFGLVLPR